MKFLQTKPKVKSMSIDYYNLFHTVIKNRDGNEVVSDEYENNEIDCIKFNDVVPNHYIGRKNNNSKLG